MSNTIKKASSKSVSKESNYKTAAPRIVEEELGTLLDNTILSSVIQRLDDQLDFLSRSANIIAGVVDRFNPLNESAVSKDQSNPYNEGFLYALTARLNRIDNLNDYLSYNAERLSEIV